MKIHIVAVEIADDAEFYTAKVSMFDSLTVEVVFGDIRACHTAESWRAFADKMSESIDMMIPK